MIGGHRFIRCGREEIKGICSENGGGRSNAETGPKGSYEETGRARKPERERQGRMQSAECRTGKATLLCPFDRLRATAGKISD